jgi:uncharacterized membrane protein YgcG
VNKTIQTVIRFILSAVLFTFLGFTVSAQKLANIQEGSIWAPANVKVDAQLGDWNNTFQAYNKTTDVFYTIANTESNLYLVIKSGNATINNKIIGGGVNFTINTEGKKKEKDAFVVTFPVVDMKNLRNMVMQFAGGMNRQQGQEPDSAAIANMRKKAISIDKEIKLVGFKDIPDSVISIYNEYGIKAAVDFDNKGNLVMEILIPLKYLHIVGDKDASFAYNLKLNGINLNGIIPGGNARFGGDGPGGGGSFGGGGGFGGSAPAHINVGAATAGMADIANLLNPTDFWAKYILAKK